MNPNIIKKIENIIGSDNITTREEDLHCYSFDGTRKNYLPEAVAFPQQTDHVAQIMKLATEYRFPVVPRGAGSGMTGGAVPLQGGLVLSTAKMNKILEIDQDNQIAVVQPGVVTGKLQQEVKKVGLSYPPDPASLKYCTIGGNVAECAGGPSAVKYGVTKDFILGLEIVLPSGEVLVTGPRTEKGVTGYDLTRLFVGSEGTLGIITKIFARLLPLPVHKETFLIESNSLEKATQMVAKLLNSNITPCTLEYMDKTTIGIVRNRLTNPPPETVAALLLIELDGEKSTVREQTARLLSLFDQPDEFTVHHAQTDEEVKELWMARRAISPSTFDLKPNKIGEDVAVPRSKIPDLVAYTEQLSKELNLIILTFGHAGDGNIHVNIMLDKSDPQEAINGQKAVDLLFRHTIKLQGTLSGEHGIGISKQPYLTIELDDTTITVMKSLKQLFDPLNILNPGKIFPESKP